MTNSVYITGGSADQVWRRATQYVYENGSAVHSRAGLTREVLHAVLAIGSPERRIVHSRPMNLAFAFAELLWTLTGSDRLDFLVAWNPRMRHFSDDAKSLHGAYGPRLRTRFGLDQLRAAAAELRDRPESRQAVLQVWDSSSDFPIGGPRSRDVPCSVADHLIVRDGALNWLHFMRANDLFWGTPYDVFVFTCLQEILAGWIGVRCGIYTHTVGTLHIYERHFWSAACITPTQESSTSDQYPALALSEELCILTINTMWDLLLRIIALSDAAEIVALTQHARPTIPHSAYYDMLAILVSDLLCRRGHLTQGVTLVDDIQNIPFKLCHRKWLKHRYSVDDLESDAGGLSLSAKSNSTLWNNAATYFHKRHGAVGDPSRTHLNHVMLNLLQGKEQSLVLLDGGCGTGAFTRFLAAHTGFRITGCDSSSKALQIASAVDSSLEYLQADLLSLPFASSVFDVITLNFVLTDVENLADLLKESWRVLKKDGALVVSMVHPASSLDVVSERRSNIERTSPTYLPFSTNNYLKESQGLYFWSDSIATRVYHRPIQRYFHVLRSTGFCVETLLEPSDQVRAELDGLPGSPTYPRYLVFRAVKSG